MVSTKEILDKYSRKIESQIEGSSQQTTYSSEYIQFKEDMIPEIGRYEKWAKSLGNLIQIKVAQKDKERIDSFLKIAHLDVTASQVTTLAVVAMLVIFLGTLGICTAIYLINGSTQILLGFLGLIASIFVFYITLGMPQRIANSWRLKTSSQMVPAILYVVVYMKHTSNLERAIEFAAQHLQGPLALDLKKVFYNVEIGKYSTIKQSLDAYLETWKEYAPEFTEAFHLIESSLFEPSDIRRVQILEKSLQIILDGIYEKMLKYSREIRSPLTNIYMLGIILPTLGLALLPLASTLLGGVIQWQHVFVLFNIIIPFFVFYLSSEVLLKRPGGYGDSTILEMNPDYPKFISKDPWIKAGLIAFPILLIGLIPFIFQSALFTDLIGLHQNDFTFADLGVKAESFQNIKIFDFRVDPITKKTSGPFGPIGTLFSLFIPLSFAIFFSLSYKLKTRDLIKSREKTVLLEEEFTNSLFQLGNRLGDGVPAEIAFAKVAESTTGQTTQSFFSLVNQNIQQVGMSVESAIFNKQRGAITYYPSALIATSMRILIESVKKGLQAAARSLMSISDYIKNIQKINQRLRDLLAEVVSDMSSNMTFLAPLLAGIVVGLSSMITMILSRLEIIKELGGGEASGLGNLDSILNMFQVNQMIPPYFLQVSVGIYLIEMMFILTAALVTVDSGKDTLKEKSELSKFIRTGMALYIFTALASTLALSVLAAIALSNL